MRSRDDDRPVRPPAAARLAGLDVVEVDVERLVSGGDGLARIEGIPLFVPEAAPGDRLRVRIVERRPNYGRAEIVELLAPGPARREPPCRHYADCGGCDLQHLDDEAQFEAKASAVLETLRRLGGISTAEIAVGQIRGAPWAYRLRTQLHVEPGDPRSRVGYRRRRSHELVEIEECPVCRPELEARLVDLPDSLGAEAPPRLDLAVGDEGRVTSAPVAAGLPRGQVSVRVGEITYWFDARCFFQGHSGLLDELVETVVGDGSGERAADLYGGVGLFALPMARRYGQVVLVEGDSVAARYARINARRNRLRNVEVTTRAVDRALRSLPGDLDRVIVDPPRAGLSPAVRGWLASRKVGRLTYVSCHPAALARDLGALCETYRLEEMTLIDLFPQTSHMEVVAQLA